MTIAQKLWLGFGSLIAIMVLIVLALLVSMWRLGRQVDNITQVAGPANEAAHEMEINVNGVGIAVSNYLHTGRPIHRRRAEADAREYKRYLNEFERLARAERQLQLSSDADELFDRYLALGEELMDQKDNDELNEVDLTDFMELRIEIDKLLDESMQAGTMSELIPGRLIVRRGVGAIQTISLVLLAAGICTALAASIGVGRAILATEQDLVRSDARKTAILDTALDGIITIDQDGRVHEFNPAAEKIFGYPRNDVIGNEMAELIIPPELRERHRLGLERYLKTGTGPVLGQRIELTALRSDGKEFPVEVAITRIAASEPAFFTGYVRDISDRKRAESQLAERLRLLRLAADVGVALTRGDDLQELLNGCTRAIVEHLDAAFARIWTINTTDNVLELQASSGMYTHTDGGHARIPVGKYKIGMIAENRKPHLTNHVIGDPSVPEQDWAREEGMVAFAGYPLLVGKRLVGVMAMFARHELSEATLNGLASIADEIALGIEHQRAEEQLIEANERLEQRIEERTQELADSNEALARSNGELEQFASVASHDLQEPLRKIQAFGDRLNTKYYDSLDEGGRDYIKRMLSAATRMRRLIDDLLAFSRVATNAQPFAPVDLGEILDDVVGDLEGRLESSGGRVDAGELPTIDADPMQMRQLLQNLIANGLKFRKPNEPPVVRVSAQQVFGEDDEPLCQLNVQDNGVGFEEKYHDRIFEVFQRLHGRLEYEGTGMGLAICRKIVERHGGAIAARSDPGNGATFIVTLPVRQEEDGPAEHD